ncbi:MAG TPA: type IV pilus assembly protein PilM [Candidatus Saccharimonadales bacterium]|jgi:type IV pilus assembly protein PilM|nr:type IV pilus assembly protein PilM [Candidatus Saccharimonadales bacterium]
MNKPTYFYKDKPLFGLDIGHGSLKAMQLGTHDGKTVIDGYGTTKFDIHALDDGVIIDPKAIATKIHAMFQHDIVGRITAKRVAMAIPTYRTFSRAIQLPKLSDAELREAVQLELEQYVPVPLQDLYLDYVTTNESANGIELFVVAVPKKIVDSYLALSTMIGLEAILIEPTMAACARLFSNDRQSDVPSLIIDFGSLTADICIVDKTVLATSTVPAGGLVFTEAIRNKLQITLEEAGDIKTKYGLDVSKVQKEVVAALQEPLEQLVTEIRRMLRYYEERYGPDKHVGQIVILGGGANMPGLGDYLTDVLKVPTRTHNHPWALFEHDGLKPPIPADRLMYVTVAGLALMKSGEVFRT